ncbi:MAG TPA: hypothetical protein VJV39_19215 [Dongiaceae bacterium]|nr:hypothetical protein [Dongiaceae bacterium]
MSEGIGNLRPPKSGNYQEDLDTICRSLGRRNDAGSFLWNVKADAR